MKKFIVFALLMVAGFWYYTHHQGSTIIPFQAPKIIPVQDLQAAMRQAYTEKKMLFILYGREGCSNCRTLRSYIDDGEVQMDLEKFVYADINCDNKETKEEFWYRFHVDGSVLPFVVIADSSSRQFASRSGYGQPEEFRQLIQDALAR